MGTRAGAAERGRGPFPGPATGLGAGGSEARGAALPSTGPSRGAREATGCVTAQATLCSHVVNPESRDFYEAGGGHWSDATSGGAGVSAEICAKCEKTPFKPLLCWQYGRGEGRAAAGGLRAEFAVTVGQAPGCTPVVLKTKVGSGPTAVINAPPSALQRTHLSGK